MKLKAKSFSMFDTGSDNIFDCEKFINEHTVVEVIKSEHAVLVIYRVY